MGRHRRSAGSGEDPPHLPPRDRAPMGIAPYLNPEAYAEANARAHAYLFADDSHLFADDSATPPAAGTGAPLGHDTAHRHRKRGGRRVRAGLLGVSAAVALGTVAVATGVVPGLEHYRLGGGSSTTGGGQARSAASPGNTSSEQGGTSGSADTTTAPAPTAPSTGHSPTAPAEPASPSAARTPATKAPSPSRTAAPKATPPAPKATPSAPSHTAANPPSATAAPTQVSKETVAAAEVLRLVNVERAKAGRAPLAANSSLSGLAEAFSDDMAARDFFDHTDPDGATPWDRAAKAGVTDLGGENIARGQAAAADVVAAWMDSPGHRANILNPDFKTLGVGVHLGPGGPWWTQDFGY